MHPSSETQMNGTTSRALGSFEFDPETRRLCLNGKQIHLPGKAIELHALLAAHEDELVSRQAIFDAMWPEGFVHEGNLTQTVYLLRRALAADPRLAIENIPRRGYRLRVAAAARNVSRSPIQWGLLRAAIFLALLACSS